MKFGIQRTDSGGFEIYLIYNETMDANTTMTSNNGKDGALGFLQTLLIIASMLLFLATFPLSLIACIEIVNEYERAVIFRLGILRAGGPRGPGMFFILPCIDEFIKVDLRVVVLNIPSQETLTKDSVTVSVDAVVYYKIQEPLNAVIKVHDYVNSTRLLALTTLRNILGTKNLTELLSDKEGITATMQTVLDEATKPWGIKVERVEITDVKLPVQLQRAMAAEAEATREAGAKVIAAQGEMNASKALKQASDIISQSPGALQLRYLQTLGTIASENSTTIVFPVPLDPFSLLKA